MRASRDCFKSVILLALGWKKSVQEMPCKERWQHVCFNRYSKTCFSVIYQNIRLEESIKSLKSRTRSKYETARLTRIHLVRPVWPVPGLGHTKYTRQIRKEELNK